MAKFLPQLGICLLLAQTAWPQCENAGTTVETTNCYADELKKADAELNKIYKAALADLEGKDAVKLRKAQRAWMAYRDAQCDAEYGTWGGGSGGPAAHLACLGRLTHQRTAEIRETYHLRGSKNSSKD
ncbi:MAG TPA: lysozyme inhibitor LprI family protein [Candidatus Angelobacter sp.]|nr:lysozyme inhibitor LprI family protein [Candidatus Angelobacter sp.]